MGGTMTAEPLSASDDSFGAPEPEPDVEPQPVRWPVPPPNGYTVDHLSTLPDLPPHTELIDGSLVFVSPQRDFHSTIIDLLVTGLRQYVPRELKVRREMTVVLNARNAPEPDICLVRAEAVTGPLLTRFEAEDVVLAIEVVSPDSEARDKDAKPRKYAKAGIPHFWLVELAEGENHPVVRTYELDPVSDGFRYTPTGIHHNQLKLVVPFELDVDISTEALERL
ncbi:Uma2 family endonuclease [Streptomyces lichenis]|uniref:Uma2 family endonuclease n=2 Tax=Streptomyces lichenis TaxID=2306967 RepID=A0ABT0IFV4_9ACTN|nr:Uma2 family endonuclease [Streptomyces lichenis]MCK8680145.1 Uma2 family endonuclease [Streptomyces lichenis]